MSNENAQNLFIYIRCMRSLFWYRYCSSVLSYFTDGRFPEDQRVHIYKNVSILDYQQLQPAKYLITAHERPPAGPRRGLLGAGGETSGVASSCRLPSFGAGGALPTHCDTCARHMDTPPEDRSTERRGGETRLISREAEAVCSLTVSKLLKIIFH